MNKITKGNYYMTKTKKFYINQGYAVEKIEHINSIFIPEKDDKPAHTIYIKKDLWGGDLVAVKKDTDEIIWISCKSNPGDIRDGILELEKSPLPAKVRKIVAYWPLRAREPEITEIEEG